MEEDVTFEELGEELKKARLAKKWRLREIARRTRIQIEYVKNLEEGNFNFMPDPVIRGFIKSYARDTGLNQDEILHKYEQIKKGIHIPAELPKPQVKKTEEEKTAPEPTTVAAAKRKTKLAAPEQLELIQKTPPTPDKTTVKTPKPAEPTRPQEPKTASKLPGKFATYRSEIILAILLVIILISIVYVYLKFGRSYFGQKEEPVKKITVFEARKENLAQEALKDSLKAPLPQLPDSVTLRIATRQQTWVRMIIDQKDTSEIMFFPAMKRSFTAKQQFELKMGRADGLLLWVNQDSLGAIGSAGEFVERVVISKQGIIDKKIRRARPVAPPN